MEGWGSRVGAGSQTDAHPEDGDAIIGLGRQLREVLLGLLDLDLHRPATCIVRCDVQAVSSAQALDQTLLACISTLNRPPGVTNRLRRESLREYGCQCGYGLVSHVAACRAGTPQRPGSRLSFRPATGRRWQVSIGTD